MAFSFTLSLLLVPLAAGMYPPPPPPPTPSPPTDLYGKQANIDYDHGKVANDYSREQPRCTMVDKVGSGRHGSITKRPVIAPAFSLRALSIADHGSDSCLTAPPHEHFTLKDCSTRSYRSRTAPQGATVPSRKGR